MIDSLGNPPLILGATISPRIVNLDTISQNLAAIQFIATARIVHQEGLSKIVEVDYAFSDAAGIQSPVTGQLFDNGASPDRNAGDSMFTAEISIPMQSLPVGRYYCKIIAQDPHGFTSSTFFLPIDVGRQLNHPPLLSNLQAPDTIVLAGQSQQFIMVKATDPDGLADIAKVFFKSYKPDGSAANKGIPILMYDDGSENVVFAPDITSGDAAKGDGIYTFPLIVDTTAAVGRYRFVFQATDRSNASSDTLTHYIYIKR